MDDNLSKDDVDSDRSTQPPFVDRRKDTLPDPHPLLIHNTEAVPPTVLALCMTLLTLFRFLLKLKKSKRAGLSKTRSQMEKWSGVNSAADV